jgi:hypothetical protein
MVKRLVTLTAVLASAALLGGCVDIKAGPSLAQQDVVGKVRATLTICQHSGNSADPACPGSGNSMTAGGAVTGQLLVAFRVPGGAAGPETFSSTSGVPLTFSRSESYRLELQRLLPPAGGLQWIAYVSAPATGVPAGETTLNVDIELPPEHPFVGPFKVRAVAGARSVDASNPADRAVACGDDPYTNYPPVTPQATVCVDSPQPAVVVTDINFAVRDFGVLAGTATASPGQTVSLPFNVRGAGALPAGSTASLSADSNLPGAGAIAPSAASAALANGSDTRATVAVKIPKKAGPGVFDVTLTGRLDNGQTRTGVAKLTVRDRQKPVLAKLKAKPKRFKAATRRKPKRGTNVSFTLSEAASFRLTVERCAKRKRGRCVRWKALKGGLTKAGVKGANKIRFNGRLRGKALAAGAYRLALKPTDGVGNIGKVVRTAIVVRG